MQKKKSSYAQFSVFTTAGTPVFNEYKDKINISKFEEFTQWQLVFDHDNLSKQDITELLDYSLKEYYTNPLWIIHFIKSQIKIFMKIYLTGYTGFIGNSLYQTLSSKYEIIRVNLRKVNFLNNDELNDFLNIFNDSNIVINCAAKLKPQNKNDFFINEQFPNILSNHLQSKNKNSKIIHLSTINVLIEERKDLYTISKKKGEENLKIIIAL